jgi:C1A family cysteine protease
MAGVGSCDFGWCPDLADHRDYSLRNETVGALMRRLKIHTRKRRAWPASVDWREYCGPIEDQQDLPTSAAHAGVALFQQFERRASGQLVLPSRMFVHHAAQRLLGGTGNADISLRWVFKAMARCCLPPERYWPYDRARLASEPDPFLYSFQREGRNLRYVRLDSRQMPGPQVLDQVKSFLTAGFFLAMGFPVCTSVGDGAEIPFPTAADGILGGQAVTAVGYDDKLRIRSDKGALLVRNSWGTDWGDKGFGWLPYSYVTERLAVDFWTLLKPSWLRSAEFERPD